MAESQLYDFVRGQLRTVFVIVQGEYVDYSHSGPFFSLIVVTLGLMMAVWEWHAGSSCAGMPCAWVPVGSRGTHALNLGLGSLEVPLENSAKNSSKTRAQNKHTRRAIFGGRAQSLHCLGLSVACNPPLIAPFESAPGSFATQPEGKAIRQQGRRG